MKISKIVAGMLVVGTTMAFGFSGGCGDTNRSCSGKMGKTSKHQMEKRGDFKGGCSEKMGMKHHDRGGDFGKGILGMIDTLNLTSEQKTKIAKIVDENKPKMAEPLEAFSGDTFDTKKFVDMMQNQKIEMIKHQAELISKVYSVLTSEQKIALKEKLKNMADGKGKCDKSSSCRG